MQNIDEGYTKFLISWKESDPLNDNHLEELIHYRNELYKLKLIGAFENQIGFGNISCRTEGEQFIISGTQTGNIPILEEKHFCLIESCDLQKNEVICSGPVKASSESLTHFAFYKSDPGIQAVIHVHDFNRWNYLLGYAPTTDSRITYGTPEMAIEISRILKTAKNKNHPKIIVTAGHPDGIFTYGGSLKEAYDVIASVLPV